MAIVVGWAYQRNLPLGLSRMAVAPSRGSRPLRIRIILNGPRSPSLVLKYPVSLLLEAALASGSVSVVFRTARGRYSRCRRAGLSYRSGVCFGALGFFIQIHGLGVCLQQTQVFFQFSFFIPPCGAIYDPVGRRTRCASV